jgi:hypothetical protein
MSYVRYPPLPPDRANAHPSTHPIYTTPSMLVGSNGAAVFIANADHFNQQAGGVMVTFVYEGHTVAIMAFYHPGDAEAEFQSFLSDPNAWIAVHHYPLREVSDSEDSEGGASSGSATDDAKPGRVLPGAWEVDHVGPEERVKKRPRTTIA